MCFPVDLGQVSSTLWKFRLGLYWMKAGVATLRCSEHVRPGIPTRFRFDKRTTAVGTTASVNSLDTRYMLAEDAEGKQCGDAAAACMIFGVLFLLAVG